MSVFSINMASIVTLNKHSGLMFVVKTNSIKTYFILTDNDSANVASSGTNLVAQLNR